MTLKIQRHPKMKAKLFTFIMYLTISVASFSQQKKVAVYMTGEDTGVNKVLGDKLVSAFARSGKYIAVERTSSFLSELSKEQTYQRTGAVSDNEIVALGIQFGVNFVCVADVSDVFNEKFISARLIDVETAEIVNTYSIGGQMKSMDKCIQMANEIAENLTKGTFEEQAATAQIKAMEEARIAAEAKRKAEAARKAEELRRATEIEEAREHEETVKRIKEATRISELERKRPLKREYVDLGLPSSTKWKACNENKEYKYDSAVNKFGDNLPTQEQWKELKDYCKWEWNGCGYKITGPNGNSIVLPATEIGWHTSGGVGGFYWIMDERYADRESARVFHITKDVINYLNCIGFKVYPRPVRLIRNY